MIQLIEALSYRALRDISQDVRRFQLLVGPNASGKSTFLDVVALIGDLLDQRRDVPDVLRKRSPRFEDLTFMQEGSRVDLAIEAGRADLTGAEPSTIVRYEIALGLDTEGTLGVLGENLWLKPAGGERPGVPQLQFPAIRTPREALVLGDRKQAPVGWRKVVSKSSAGNDYFKAEAGKWNAPFRFGPQRLALANLPEDEERFPARM